MNPEVIDSVIRQAVITQDNAQLESCVCTLKAAILKANNFLEQYFVLLLRWLNDREFLQLPAAWNFFAILKNCRELLSDSQKQNLLTAIETAYKNFDEMSLEQIEEAVYRAINDGDITQLEKCNFELDKSMLGLDHFPEESFQFLINLMNQQDFLEMECSWHLLMVVMYNWELISDLQKDKLLSSLEVAYSKFQDWMSHFIISELLGGYFADERAFQVLCRLKMLKAEVPRSFVPHGLEHIFKDTKDKNLSRKAYADLLEMKEDSSEKVRDEVDESLRRLANAGLKCE